LLLFDQANWRSPLEHLKKINNCEKSKRPRDPSGASHEREGHKAIGKLLNHHITIKPTNFPYIAINQTTTSSLRSIKNSIDQKITQKQKNSLNKLQNIDYKILTQNTYYRYYH
jgi:hypothetical protein